MRAVLEGRWHDRAGGVYSTSLVRAEKAHGEIAWARVVVSQTVILTLGMDCCHLYLLRVAS